MRAVLALPLPTGVTCTQLDALLPELTINLGTTDTNSSQSSSAALTLVATGSYLSVQYDSVGNLLVCPAVGVSANNFVLGDAVMRSHVFIFDSVNDQIGFAPQVGCDVMVRAALPTLQ